MDPLAHQFAERGIDFALPLDPVQAGEGGTFDGQREVAFAARIVPGMADMLVALVLQIEPCRRERRGQSIDHFAGDRSGTQVATRQTKWHGRVEGTEARCSVPGCREPGEFRAPLSPSDFDGPGRWRLLIDTHVEGKLEKTAFARGDVYGVTARSLLLFQLHGAE